MNKTEEIEVLRRRVSSLEDMTLSLISFIKETIYIDEWDDRRFLEKIREFEEGIDNDQ